MKRLRRFKVALLATCMGLGLAHAQERGAAGTAPAYVQEPASAQVVSTPGGEAIITQINMGPFATAFWRKLQSLADNPDWLSDFPKLVEMFDLKLTDSPGQAVPNQWRMDIKDRPGGFIESGRYRDGRFVVQLNRNLICLSGPEITRVFGNAKLILPIVPHQPLPPDEAFINPIGYGHNMNYSQVEKKRDLLFLISPSGCTREVFISRNINTQ